MFLQKTKKVGTLYRRVMKSSVKLTLNLETLCYCVIIHRKAIMKHKS
jgi:hypothetical protein